MLRERDLQRLQQQLDQTQAELRQMRGNASPDEPTPHAITLTDEQGNPMVIPYYPMLMEAMRREQEAKARKTEWEEMVPVHSLGGALWAGITQVLNSVSPEAFGGREQAAQEESA